MQTTQTTLLREALLKRGLDICVELNTSWYNEIKPLPHLVSFPEQKRGLLIANSKHVWPFFTRWFSALPEPLAHPFDTFVAEQLAEALREARLEPLDVFYVQDTARLVAFQRLAQVTGICVLDLDLHLCVHPVFGPWFALRALVVLDEPSAMLQKPSLPVIELDKGEVQQSVQWLERALKTLEWTSWAEMRKCISLGKEHRYSKAQLIYHYSKQQTVVLLEDEKEEEE
ncbi:hypothetical protein BASA81_005826 [Batrachochytrium salamandrivorans]|nr:hypothetical protein BASA81_005826 [Batrachochytrium salamandrivorans]